MLPVALVRWVKTTIAFIARGEAPAAGAAHQHALQQAVPLAGRSAKHLAVGLVRCETMAVGEEAIPGDVARMMIGDGDAPLVPRREMVLISPVGAICLRDW